jgi:hypothetical protein
VHSPEAPVRLVSDYPGDMPEHPGVDTPPPDRNTLVQPEAWVKRLESDIVLQRDERR